MIWNHLLGRLDEDDFDTYDAIKYLFPRSKYFVLVDVDNIATVSEWYEKNYQFVEKYMEDSKLLTYCSKDNNDRVRIKEIVKSETIKAETISIGEIRKLLFTNRSLRIQNKRTKKSLFTYYADLSGYNSFYLSRYKTSSSIKPIKYEKPFLIENYCMGMLLYGTENSYSTFEHKSDECENNYYWILKPISKEKRKYLCDGDEVYIYKNSKYGLSVTDEYFLLSKTPDVWIINIAI